MSVYFPNDNWFDINGNLISSYIENSTFGRNLTIKWDLIANTIPWFIK